jgi:hypothetical protein
MIDKTQIPIITQMIKTFYEPVMLRALVNLVLMDMSQITLGGKGSVKEILMTERAQKALIESLDQHHRPRKHDLIDTILKEYGLNLLRDEQDFYHQQMGAIFERQVDYVIALLKGFNYKHIHNLSKVAVN